jgi:hypothetical protein
MVSNHSPGVRRAAACSAALRGVVHLLLDLDQLLLDLLGLLLDVLHDGLPRLGCLRLDDELVEQEQAHVVFRPFHPDLERRADDVQQPEQREEEEREEADRDQGLGLPIEVRDHQQHDDERDEGHDHRVGRGKEFLPLQVVDAQHRPAQPGLLGAQADDVVRGSVRFVELPERLRQVLDRRLARACVARVDIGPQRRDHGDQAPPQLREIGHAPDGVHRLALPQDRVQPGGEVRGGPLGVPVVGQRAGDHETHDEDPAGDDAGRDSGRRQPLDPELPQQRPDPDEQRDDGQRRDAELEVAERSPQQARLPPLLQLSRFSPLAGCVSTEAASCDHRLDTIDEDPEGRWRAATASLPGSAADSSS